jgi:ABC-type dipeptide/oligopeptide/nickel transport system permease component
VIAFFVISLAIFLPTQAVFNDNSVEYFVNANHLYNINITEEQYNNILIKLSEIYNLDKPLIMQYFLFMDGFFVGNYPPSLVDLL